jgi:hypothetical protein
MMNPPLPASPRPAPQFLSWKVLLAAVPFAVVQLLAARPPAELNENAAIGFMLGTAMWSLVIAAVVAWVPWRLARRPRYVAPVLFLATYALMTVAAASKSAGLPRGAGAATPGSATTPAPAITPRR